MKRRVLMKQDITPELKPKMKRASAPNECATCGRPRPCKCSAGAGGASADDKNEKDENAIDKKEADAKKNEFVVSAMPSLKSAVSLDNDTPEIQNNRPAWCTLFATTALQLVPASSAGNIQNDDAMTNGSSMGMSMSMSMSGMDE